MILVTGATGIVGHSIARALVGRGRPVRALVRSLERARTHLPPGCAPVVGDVTDAASVRRAMEGATAVYHAAGLPEQWLRDPSAFERVNVGGTRNVVEAALAEGVARFVYTSTIDVFAGTPGVEFDEAALATAPKGTYYQRSKQEADRVVAAALDRGLGAVFLHPSAVYGPAPAGSPGLNDFIGRIVRRQIPMLLPGGTPLVFAPDVAAGHVLAEETAAPGARYILSESYWELVALARAVCEAAGAGRVPPVLPGWVAHVVAGVGEAISGVLGRPPLIPRGQLHFLESGTRPSARRAREELGWRPTPFREALGPTLAFVGCAPPGASA
jgi:nucleoside-diphosphate-sugar epimerase